MSKAAGEAREFIAELTRIGMDVLARQLQLPADDGRRVMRDIADQVCMEYARREIYIPVAYDPRNREIVAKYHQASRNARACSPERVKELSLEYALHTRQIYGIIQEAREADLRARQGVLPGLEDEPA